MITEPHYRRPLSDHQFAILNLLYRFRFATTELLALSLHVKYKNKMNQRLKVLLDQEYIGRNFEPSYHLSGQHASYYLEAKGIQALKRLPGSKYTLSVLRNIYKDKDASKRFINHWLEVFHLYCLVKDHYGERLRFFSKSEIAGFDYFPKRRPDGYIRLMSGNIEYHYMLEVLDSSEKFFVQTNMVKRYINYAEDGDWEDATGTELPTVLLVCSTTALQLKLQKFVDYEIDDPDSGDLRIRVITKAGLIHVLHH